MQLSALQEKYQDYGFSVLAFPSNDFHQELKTNQDVHNFLQEQFKNKINFPVFGITSLADNPVYQQLRKHIPDQQVQHNFFKYLVDRNGIAQALFHKKQDPITLEPNIEKVLQIKQYR